MGEPTDSTDEAPKPAPRSTPQPSLGFLSTSAPASDSMGTWGDRDDLADRQAFDAARREQLDARPPHH